MALAEYFFRDISYKLVLNVKKNNDDKCEGRIRFNEAIEFAMRTSSSSDAPWIPLWLTYHKSGHGEPKNGMATIRGYNVTAHLSKEKIVTESVHICGNLLHDVQEVQFRWMATNDIGGSRKVRKRMWALANVSASLVIENETIKILDDTFGQNTLK